MKLSQLCYFQSVCKFNSVTKAAEALHISQPSISSAIRQLEDEFGVDLFHRNGKRLYLTQEGEYCLKQAGDILQKAEALSQRMRELGSGQNNIRIGVPPMIGTFLFPSMFRSFRALHPAINLEIQEYGSLHTIRLVNDETLDMAIVITNEIDMPQLNILNILDTQILFCVDRTHPLAGRACVDVADIKDEPLVLMKEGSYQALLIKERFKQEGLRPNVVLFSNQLLTVKNFISDKIASAFLIKEIADKNEDIAGLKIADPLGIHIGLIWKKHKHMYSDAAKFIQFTKQYQYQR